MILNLGGDVLSAPECRLCHFIMWYWKLKSSTLWLKLTTCSIHLSLLLLSWSMEIFQVPPSISGLHSLFITPAVPERVMCTPGTRARQQAASRSIWHLSSFYDRSSVLITSWTRVLARYSSIVHNILPTTATTPTTTLRPERNVFTLHSEVYYGGDRHNCFHIDLYYNF